ncbi:insulinoma-associated protein 1-like [Amphibalanus amphitrite]|uniref:insulinoma-associated protein 1-like n=1 Tax=Amphibalanus amphitrite TaxID=1232801 RepID=UPI001C919BFC|nr:insulinoma-associated protein 1-like [Amphibalanus amphitrite]
MSRDLFTRRDPTPYSDGERSDLSSEPELDRPPLPYLPYPAAYPTAYHAAYHAAYSAAYQATYPEPFGVAEYPAEQEEPLNLTLPRPESPPPAPVRYSYLVRRRDEHGAEHVTYLSPQRPRTPPAPPAAVARAHSLSKSCPPAGASTPERASGAEGAGAARRRKHRATRRLTFDEEKSSPISGTLIRDLAEGETVSGDIDPALNTVEVTEQARSELAKIPNRIGEYACTLCRTVYEDAFTLAQHRCPRIVHVEYRCPECDKVFNCPANLASHRRWHRPRAERTAERAAAAAQEVTDDSQLRCYLCGKAFKRAAALKKHIESHATERLGAALPGGRLDYLSLYADQKMSLALPGAGLLTVAPEEFRDRSPVR